MADLVNVSRPMLFPERSIRGGQWAGAYTSKVDAWIASLLEDDAPVSIIAIGSYGRSELCPESDLDIILLYPPRSSRERVQRLADALWYPIWDAGFSLDHSVKTVKQVIAVGDEDLRSMLAVMSARSVAGRPDLADQLIKTTKAHLKSNIRRFVADIRDSSILRYRESGELSSLVEPDLKQSQGGLRDYLILCTLLEVSSSDALPSLEEVEWAHELLLDVRVELHLLTARNSDRLGLAEQDQIAATLGYRSSDHLMKSLSEAGRAISFALTRCFHHLDRRTLMASERLFLAAGSPDLPSVKVRDSGVELVVEIEPGSGVDVGQVLTIANLAARYRRPLAWSSLQQMLQEFRYSREVWSPEILDSFVALLQSGEGLIEVVEALDASGIMEFVLPEWTMVSCKPQRNAFHRYTVDRHLLEAVVAANARRRQVHRPDILVLAALFHDIGKGSDGDHTDNGVRMLATIGTRIGLPQDDQELIIRLIQHHLLLADAAMRRDLSDPATIERVADAVGDGETLELLAALTEADSKATGNLAWSQWKETLIGDLVARTARFLAGESSVERALPISDEVLGELLSAAQEGFAVVVRNHMLFVAAPDRPGLLSIVAGSLALSGLSVISAEVFAFENVAVEALRVVSSHGGDPDYGRFKVELAKSLTRSDYLADRMAQKKSIKQRRRLRAATLIPPRVVLDEAGSQTATIIEVWSEDRAGLLYDLTRAIASCNFDIRHAKIMTLGEDVVDSFYVVDPDGGPMREEGEKENLMARLLEVTSLH